MSDVLLVEWDDIAPDFPLVPVGEVVTATELRNVHASCKLEDPGPLIALKTVSMLGSMSHFCEVMDSIFDSLGVERPPPDDPSLTLSERMHQISEWSERVVGRSIDRLMECVECVDSTDSGVIEASAPLRSEDDDGMDNLGSDYDPGQMGAAEAWFRNIRSE